VACRAATSTHAALYDKRLSERARARAERERFANHIIDTIYIFILGKGRSTLSTRRRLHVSDTLYMSPSTSRRRLVDM